MSDSEFSEIEENYDFEDGNYGDDGTSSDFYEERSSSPIPEDDIPVCLYCGQSLLSIPHICGATKGCQNKNSIIDNKCQCQWHKQIKEM